MDKLISNRLRHRRGTVVVLTAFLLVVLFGMIAFALDIGYVVLVRTQLQSAADSAAMAAAATMNEGSDAARQIAKQYGAQHFAAGSEVQLADADIEFGIWDSDARTFTPTSSVNNAVRVTARRDSANVDGEAGFFFGKIFGEDTFPMTASCIAMATPRDIAFVVDLSGSMNDDTEPVWATGAIDSEFGSQGHGAVGSELMQQVFDDFSFGAFPGQLQHLGAPLGVPSDNHAYAVMTMDGGPLSSGVASHYLIQVGDSEQTRKQKTYSWVIDHQIASLMPAALPSPDSSTNYSFWEKYLDYVVKGTKVSYDPNPPPPPPPDDDDDDGGSSNPPPPPPPSDPPPPPPPSPPSGFHIPGGAVPWQIVGHAAPQWIGRRLPFAVANQMGWHSALLCRLMLSSSSPPGAPPNQRGWLPPSQSSNRVDRMNNPNKSTFPQVSGSVPRGYRNKIGYLTYVAFMMDHGRNLRPNGSTYTPLSRYSPDCPRHSESTPGGSFMFPPRSQPMHAARRAVIAAMAHVKSKNEIIPSFDSRDWVSIVAFDTLSSGGPAVQQPLTGDYQTAMEQATELQAVGDNGQTTATEAGMAVAAQHLLPTDQGGQGRKGTDKVVILLTDGVPNLWQASEAEIDIYVGNNPHSDFYGGGYYWYDAALMQTDLIKARGWQVFPVGIGLGTDYGFMDRMARMGGTASDGGQSPRGSGNPSEYEQRLVDIFKEIIDTPGVGIVE